MAAIKRYIIKLKFPFKLSITYSHKTISTFSRILSAFSQVVKAHKAFLAHSSPVFHAMFFGEMGQAALGGKNNLLSPQNDVIAVPDVTPTSFKALLE